MYNSLDTLPIKCFYRIVETGDLSLLNPETETSAEQLKDVWANLNQDFQSKDNNQISKKIFRISVEIEFLTTKYNLVGMCVNALRFDYDDELITILKKLGYKITKENYLNDLEKTEKYSEGILMNIERLKQQLPKDKREKNEFSIDDVLASFCTMLGFQIGDFNKITCSEYFAYKGQVLIKVKAQEKELQELKAKKNGR